MHTLGKILTAFLFALLLVATRAVHAADEPATFTSQAKALIYAKAIETNTQRSTLAGDVLRALRPVSTKGLIQSKETLADIIDAGKLLLVSDDPADVFLGLRTLECIEVMLIVEISRQYASERGEALSIGFVEQSVDAEIVDFLSQRRAIDPKKLLKHVMEMQGHLQKELLAHGLEEDALIKGVRLRHLSDEAAGRYDTAWQDLRYLDALPVENKGDYLLLASLSLCDIQTDNTLFYKAYQLQSDVLRDQISFSKWVKEEIVRHPSKRLLEGKKNAYVLRNPVARKLFFQKDPREVKFWFLGERMWPFISGMTDGHGLTVEEKAVIQQFSPVRRLGPPQN